MKTIILTGGGTLGHVIPHFAILPYLKHDKVYYVGSTNGIEKNYVKSKNLPYLEINPVKLHRSFSLKNLCIPIGFIKSIKECEKIVKELSPSVVFSKGGFVGLPLTIAAKKHNIPVVVHESDLTLGLANKIASRYAKNVLTSFEKTANSLPNGKYVGAILNEDLFTKTKAQGLNKYGFNTSKPVLLVTGGSSGAKSINSAILNSLNELTKNFQVLHITGKNNLSGIKKQGYTEVEFTDMSYAYSASDICVSRCGANTAFELTTLKKPTLYIPLPKKASRGDQIDNANYFKSLNVCDVLYQEDITPALLVKKINELLINSAVYLKNLNALNLKTANKEIADILNKYWQILSSILK